MISRSLSDLFDAPPRDFSPTPLWWWSGAAVTRERIRWQMERLAAGGVHNLVVINLAPAGPLEEAPADDPPWFSQAWWDRFADACEIAGELGTRLWFYDQIGFSGANVQGLVTRDHPGAAGTALRGQRATVSDGRVPVPRGHALLAAYDDDGRRVAVDGAGRAEKADGTPLRVVTTEPTAFDYLSTSAVALLMDHVHGELERRVGQHLGTTIAGSFQDELPATNSWTQDFPEEFRTRCGYDLLDHLPALFDRLEVPHRPGRPSASEVRADYYAVRTALTEEALFRPLGRWHSERGMLVGADQTNPARQGLPTQSTQLYTDYFRTHRWYGAAGSDHEGDAKVHSSMAHQYGHPRVWLEAFHSSGWGCTLEEVWDWLLPFLRSGATLYNPHASYFGTAGGWFEWAPPSTDWRQPYWAHYPAFAAAVSRVTACLAWGTFEAGVALLHPTTTAQADLALDLPVHHFGARDVGEQAAAADRAQQDYTALVGITNWFAPEPGLLDAAGIAFDVIDDASLQGAAVDAGRLVAREQRYSTVLLPSAQVLEEATASRLAELLDAGGRVVVVGSPPAAAAGAGGDDAVVRALAAHPRVERVATPAEAVAGCSPDDEWASSDVPLLVRRSDGHAVVLVSGAFPNASTRLVRGHDEPSDHRFDSARYAASRTVVVRARIAEAQVWDPASGARTPLAVEPTHPAAPPGTSPPTSRVVVPMDGAPLRLLVLREADADETPPAPAPAPAGAVERERVQLDGWSGELVATMDNTWGDMAVPAGAPVDELQVWTMDWAQGSEPPERWGSTRVSFGQRASTCGPVPEAGAPAPLTPVQAAAAIAGSRPLAGPGWGSASFSASRGTEKEAGRLGMKGRVLEEFVTVAAPGPGEVVVVRALVRSSRTGPADLTVSAGAAKSVWWNGVELAAGAGYSSTARVEVGGGPGGVDLLEYRLGESENVPARPDAASPLGSSFHLVDPGAEGLRPQLMTVGAGLVPDGRVEVRREFSVPGEVERARLVVGAATGLSVLLDGRAVARQEKVEYYEGAWGANPMYFQHDLSAVLGAGHHDLRIVTDSTDPRDVVFADLVVHHEHGSTVVVSGAGWTASSGGVTVATVEHRGHRGELAPSHAATRTHPLSASRWLNGDPVVGGPAHAVSTGDDMAPAPQWYRFRVPSGTTRVTLPLSVPATVWLDGEEVPVSEGAVTPAEPLRRVGEVLVRTGPVTFDRGGASWLGPAVVSTTLAPMDLGPWPDLGLRSWSGGVRYSRSVQIPSGARDVALHLGEIRGSAEVTVDGDPVGTLFCAPFTVHLGERSGEVEVAITVLGTLGPFFEESTPTTWVFPSQRVSGLSGPVSMTWSPATA